MASTSARVNARTVRGGKCRVIETPSLGPQLTPLTLAALRDLARSCNQNNGFVTGYEKTTAVLMFLALSEGNEPFPPSEVEVWAATHGWSLEQAAHLRDLAQRVIEGRSFRPAIRLQRGQGQKMLGYWGEGIR
jgi:hypothetical protein